MSSGNLYVVPTPIGNLEDITLRALRILKEVDWILAEDTRTSGKLLKYYDIATSMKSYHMHNEHKVLESYVDLLKQGNHIAIITDAGTPGISDPGFLLVRQCIQANINVMTLPGATAFVPALVSSGLPCDKFVFEGFLPVKKGRKTRLEFLAHETRTIVFYESPHKLLKTLKDFSDYFGASRQIAVSRELTKLYEEIQRGTITQVCDYFQNHKVKGELVLTVQGCI